MVVAVLVKLLSGETLQIIFCDDENPFETATVADLKERIHRLCETPVDQIRLIFNGKQLENERLLSQYKIQQESTVHMVKRLCGGAEDPHGMGERVGRNASKEQLCSFDATDTEDSGSCCIC